MTPSEVPTRLHTMNAATLATIRPGARLIYDDGRPGHTAARAEVLILDAAGMVVQFEDRADTTRIRWDDTEWTQHLTPCAS